MEIIELIKRCKDNDPDAWDEFIRKFTPLVRRCIGYKMKIINSSVRRTEIDDIAQNVFLSLWEKGRLKQLNNPKALNKWLAVISINATTSHFTKIWKIQDPEISLDENIHTDSDLKLGDVLPSEKFNPEKIIEQRELNDLIHLKLADFTPRKQLVLKFNILHGIKQKDIARIMNIPEGSVATIIKRGKEKIGLFIKNQMIPNKVKEKADNNCPTNWRENEQNLS